MWKICFRVLCCAQRKSSWCISTEGMAARWAAPYKGSLSEGLSKLSGLVRQSTHQSSHFCISSNFRYEPSREMKSQWTAVWVKISSSWIGIVLYVWTLVAPLVLTNRDFDWMGLLAWKPIMVIVYLTLTVFPVFVKLYVLLYNCFSLAWIRFTLPFYPCSCLVYGWCRLQRENFE